MWNSPIPAQHQLRPRALRHGPRRQLRHQRAPGAITARQKPADIRRIVDALDRNPAGPDQTSKGLEKRWASRRPHVAVLGRATCEDDSDVFAGRAVGQVVLGCVTEGANGEVPGLEVLEVGEAGEGWFGFGKGFRESVRLGNGGWEGGDEGEKGEEGEEGLGWLHGGEWEVRALIKVVGERIEVRKNGAAVLGFSGSSGG